MLELKPKHSTFEAKIADFETKSEEEKALLLETWGLSTETELKMMAKQLKEGNRQDGGF